MKTYLLFTMFLCFFLHGNAQDLTPKYTYQNKGSVEDFFVDGEHIIFGGSGGEVTCMHRKSKNIIKTFALPGIIDFMGDETQPKIICMDRDEMNENIIIVSQGRQGFRNVFVLEDWKPRQVIADTAQKWMITEARVVKPGHIIITLLSNEIILFNYQTQEIVYKKQIGFYTLSDMDLSSSKHQMITADESGSIYLIDISDGSIIHEYSSQNVDKVNRVCFGGNTIAGGGQDHRLSFYNTQTERAWYFKSEFLIYSMGMDTQGKILLYNADDSDALTLFDIEKKQKLSQLIGHIGIITQSRFTKDELITSSEDGKICWWDLPVY